MKKNIRKREKGERWRECSENGYNNISWIKCIVLNEIYEWKWWGETQIVNESVNCREEIIIMIIITIITIIMKNETLNGIKYYSTFWRNRGKIQRLSCMLVWKEESLWRTVKEIDEWHRQLVNVTRKLTIHYPIYAIHYVADALLKSGMSQSQFHAVASFAASVFSLPVRKSMTLFLNSEHSRINAMNVPMWWCSKARQFWLRCFYVSLLQNFATFFLSFVNIRHNLAASQSECRLTNDTNNNMHRISRCMIWCRGHKFHKFNRYIVSCVFQGTHHFSPWEVMCSREPQFCEHILQFSYLIEGSHCSIFKSYLWCLWVRMCIHGRMRLYFKSTPSSFGFFCSF